MIKAIIFDLGGAIVNVDKTEQYKKFSADSNKPFSFIKDYLDTSYLKESFEKGRLNTAQFYSEIRRELNLKMNFKNFKKEWCNIFALNKNVEKLIINLKRNFKLILLSNTDKLHFKYLKNKYKIINAFDAYVLSYEVGYRKPNLLIFSDALKKAKTLQFNCIYIDDTPAFVCVAKLIGVKAFQYKKFNKLIYDLKNIGVFP